MKKHPVDDLFARRLGDYRLDPKRATWDEFQKRQPERRIGRGVWWYAAASVLLAVLAGWWGWHELSEAHQVHSERIAVARKAAGKKPVPLTMPAPKKSLKSQETEQLPLFAQKRSDSSFKKRQADATAPKATALAMVAVAEQSESPEPVVTPPTEQTEVAKVHPSPPSERTLVVQLVEPTELASTELAEEQVVEESPKRKRVRLGRLVRQFTNLREGEPVDWQDTGLTPGTLLAKASDKVQEGKEKLSDSYQNLRSNGFRKSNNK